jgi:hypothetical protein
MSKKWKWIYNPFEKIAGWKAFGIGILILGITTILGYFSNTIFFGISIKQVHSITLCKAFSLQALSLAITVAVMYLTALFFAKRVRFQDILGTVTLAKYPLLLIIPLLWTLNDKMMEITDRLLQALQDNLYQMANVFSISDYVVLIGYSFLSLIILVWNIALLFNAFKVSTNMKGVKCGLVFTAILLVAEIIINVVISVIY